MVPVGTAAGDSWRPTISLCWSCRRTARSSIRSSGFGTICAVTGSPTRCFPAWRTSWMPARWPGTDLPTTTAWSARSAQSLGPRLRPLYSCCLLSSRGLRLKHTHVRKYPESRIRSLFTVEEMRRHLNRVECEQRKYDAYIEERDEFDEDEVILESPVVAAERARQFATIAELLTAAELGTS